MRFDNIHYTQQQVRGGHIGTRNNVFIEQNNYIMKGPEPPKMNFFQGLLTGLTGGSIFGGFGMGGMFGGCGMGSIFGGFGMPGMFGGFGMGGMMPGTFGMIGQGATTTTSQGSGEVTLESAAKQLKNIHGNRYNIEYINESKTVSITDKDGNEVYRGKSLDDAQKAIEARDGKTDQTTADQAKLKAAMERDDVVQVDGKYYKKSDTEHTKELVYNNKDDKFEEKPVAAKPKQSENAES